MSLTTSVRGMEPGTSIAVIALVWQVMKQIRTRKLAMHAPWAGSNMPRAMGLVSSAHLTARPFIRVASSAPVVMGIIGPLGMPEQRRVQDLRAHPEILPTDGWIKLHFCSNGKDLIFKNYC